MQATADGSEFPPDIARPSPDGMFIAMAEEGLIFASCHYYMMIWSRLGFIGLFMLDTPVPSAFPAVPDVLSVLSPLQDVINNVSFTDVEDVIRGESDCDSEVFPVGTISNNTSMERRKKKRPKRPCCFCDEEHQG